VAVLPPPEVSRFNFTRPASGNWSGFLFSIIDGAIAARCGLTVKAWHGYLRPVTVENPLVTLQSAVPFCLGCNSRLEMVCSEFRFGSALRCIVKYNFFPNA
jgi:hypothetical protein